MGGQRNHFRWIDSELNFDIRHNSHRVYHLYHRSKGKSQNCTVLVRWYQIKWDWQSSLNQSKLKFNCTDSVTNKPLPNTLLFQALLVFLFVCFLREKLTIYTFFPGSSHILVTLFFSNFITLVAWFSVQYFPFARRKWKINKLLSSIFVSSSPKTTKNKVTKMGCKAHL